ncbi:MAG: ammonium transporter [Acidobacteria bacterium]|nr:ammonium transporter [Acidobacteriota bacterium]
MLVCLFLVLWLCNEFLLGLSVSGEELAATEAGPFVDPGDTAWLLLSSALVLFMTPGLALFYAGMVRKKNVLGTMMHSFIAMGLISVQWVLFGCTLSFGPDKAGLVGGLEWIGLRGVGMAPNADYAATVPHQAFMIFQAMFAIITPSLFSGAFAERIRFAPFLVFMFAWATLVYDPLAHWVWGVGGWMRELGALDFAGGTVVHISSGISALALAFLIGKRKGFGSDVILPNNLTMTVLGASILWFGWFGFNAGSALTSGGLAASTFVVTHTSAAAASLGWVAMDWVVRKKPTVLGAASGAVASLVAITPASGFVGPLSAMVIGVAASILCYMAILWKTRKGFDDSLDVWGVHGVGGTWGALATGIFAQKTINPAGKDGLLFGNPGLLWIQFITVVATWAWAIIMTIILYKLISTFMDFRVAFEEEEIGLDLTQHGESGYNL